MHHPPRCRAAAIAGAVLFAAWATAFVARTTAVAAEPGPIAQSKQQPPAQPASPPTAAQPQAGATFVGTDTCLGCHDDQKKGYADTAHGRADHPRSPASARGCESCHGPGSVHVDDPSIAGSILAFLKVEPDDANQACLSCHTRDAHALWDGSTHDARNLSCVTCHSVHAFKSERAQLKTVSELDTCATCHRDKIAKLDRSGHMPVREGKMQCSTCHNPHGSTNVRLLRKGDSIAELCTSCHADKRGPYLWEHAPSRDGCTTCHDPHGSSNERMLVAKPPIMCQRCHVMTRHPSTIYDGAVIGSGATPSVRIYARSCVTCHSTIHGSNHPSGQRFIR
jgi:DmsE family decaheme c-type cytochrome